MKNVLTFALVLGPLGTAPLLAQGGEPAATNTLARALATFGAADANKDGKVSLAETTANKLPIQKADFDAMDVDKDGNWSRDEFLVFYRRLLLNSGQRAAADLESEVTRIQALRRAREGANDPRRPVEPPKIDAPLAPTIEERLTNAIAELEKKAAARQATRQDFQRVRDAMTDRARIAQAQDPAGAPDMVAKFETALAAIETKAKAGGYTREEFDALRGLLVTRAREAVKGAAQAKSEADAKAAEAAAQADAQNAANAAREKDLAAIEARFLAAIDDLAKKAEARGATREDFARVRDLYAARARAAAGASAPTPVDEQQANALQGRFARAIDALEQSAREGKFTREEYDSLRETYVNRARAAAGSKAVPDTGIGTSAPVPVPPSGAPVVPAATIEQRFDDAMAQLEQRALARGATRDDFQRVHDMIAARARAAFAAQNGGVAVAEDDPRVVDLVTKVRSALDRLERATAEGKVPREDFATMRQRLLRRAREAVGGVPAGPAEGRGATTPVEPPKPTPTPAPADGTPAGGEVKRERARTEPPKPEGRPAPAPQPETPKPEAPKPEGRPAPQPAPNPTPTPGSRPEPKPTSRPDPKR